tara:strand:- start:5212 stop:6927 length:1716 start_codon:yes stop_codon:yes gene_type:complete
MKSFLSDIRKAIILLENKGKLVKISIFAFISTILEILSLSLVILLVINFFNPELSNIKINNFINNFYPVADINNFSFFKISIFIILLYVIKNIFSAYLNYNIISFVKYGLEDFKLRIINFFYSLEYLEYKKHHSSYFLDTTFMLTRLFFSRTVSSLYNLISELIIFISILGYIIYIYFSPTIFLIITFLIFIFILLGLVRRALSILGKKINTIRLESTKTYLESIKNFKELKVYNYYEKIYKDLEEKFNLQAKFGLKSEFYPIVAKYLLEVLLILILILFLNINLKYNFYSNEIVASNALIFIIFIARLYPSFNKINNFINSFMISRNTISKLNDLFEYKIRINKYQKSKKIVHFKNHEYNEIELKNINFRYNDKKIILKNFNYKFKSKNSYFINGTSGSGKSTLVNIILGLINPNSGEINYNKHFNFSSHNVFSNFSYVPQDNFIFNNTLKFNITLELDNKKIDENNYTQCLNICGLNDIILDKTIFNNIKTIKENGANLSGGQRQRISIARALYANRNILIFDEATNSLDESSEIKIIHQILNIHKKKIIIYVSHNLNISKLFQNQIKL